MDKRTRTLLIILGVLLLAAAGYYGYMFFGKKPPEQTKPGPAATAVPVPASTSAPTAAGKVDEAGYEGQDELLSKNTLWVVAVGLILIGGGFLGYRYAISGRKTQIIGLDIGSHTIKLAQIVERGKDLVLVKFGTKVLNPELIVDGTVMDRSQVASAIMELMGEMQLKAKDVVIGVSGHSVIVKRISLPEMSQEELSESINWEAEQYIPFAIEDVNLDFQIIGPSAREGANTMDVVLVAAKKDKINDYVSLVTEAGLNPMVMDVDAFALENMFEVNYEIEPGRVDALINIGAAVMNINILKDGVSVFTRDSSVGGNLYTEALQKEFGMGFSAAEQLKMGEDTGGVDAAQAQSVLDAVSEDVSAEAARSLDFFRATTGVENVDRVILSGGSALVSGFLDKFSERVGVPMELANPFRNVSLDPKVDADIVQKVAPAAAVVVGLALRRLGD